MAHEAYEAAHNGHILTLDPATAAKVQQLAPLLAEIKSRGKSWAEVAFAYDPIEDTARVLGRGRASYAKASPHEMTGTADLVVAGPNGPEIYDYKAARKGGDAPDARAQLHTLALMASRALPMAGGTVRVAAILIDEESCTMHDDHEIDIVSLYHIRDLLRIDLARVEGAGPTPGPWCSSRYCPARAQCPATTEALAQVLHPAPAGTLRFSPVIESSSHAAWLLTHVDLVESAAAAVRSELKKYADAWDGIPVSDGRIYRGEDVVTESVVLDTPGAQELVAAAGAAAAIKSSLTWSAVEKEIGAQAGADLRERLRAIRALKVSSFRRWQYRKHPAIDAAVEVFGVAESELTVTPPTKRKSKGKSNETAK